MRHIALWILGVTIFTTFFSFQIFSFNQTSEDEIIEVVSLTETQTSGEIKNFETHALESKNGLQVVALQK